jgi:hypothetical protein
MSNNFFEGIRKLVWENFVNGRQSGGDKHCIWTGKWGNGSGENKKVVGQAF